MKTIKNLGFAIVLAVTTMLTSCSSSDGGGGAAAGTITAKAGSVSFKSMTQASYAMQQGGMLIIQGSDAQGRVIQLMLMGVSETGTYTISDTAGISVIANYSEMNLNTMSAVTWAAPYEDSGAVGTITISEITDTGVKGTFNFTGKNQSGADTKSVTNGAFNVNFQTN